MKTNQWTRPGRRPQSDIFRLMGILVIFLCFETSCSKGDPSSPSAVSDLSYFFRADALTWNGAVSAGSTAGTPDTRLLAWTAVGDDDNEGTAASYDLRFLTARDLAGLGASDGAAAIQNFFENARQIIGEPFPGPAGSLEIFFLPRIDPGDTVWIALRVLDEIGQESASSNVAGPLRIRRLMVPVRAGSGVAVPGFGQSVASAGDFNQDGYLDLAAGSPAEGRVYLVMGMPISSLITTTPNLQGISVPRAISELLPVMTISGSAGDEFGKAVSGLLVNGDGLYDLGVGAPGLDAPGGLIDAGAMYIYYGRQALESGISATAADLVITGEAAGDRFGSSLAPALDLDQDGGQELLAGAPQAYGCGAAYVFRSAGLGSGTAGLAAVVIKGEAAGDGFAAVVSGIGDVNGDAIPDLAVGAPFHDEPGKPDAGAVYVFYGGNAGAIGFIGLGAGRTMVDLSLARADVTIRGTTAGGQFGRGITAGGELCGELDLLSDFAVAAQDEVFVFCGGTGRALSFPVAGAAVDGVDLNAWARVSRPAGEDFGAAVAGPGDLNRDGIGDLVVGAPGTNVAYVFSGPMTDGMAPRESIPGLAPLSGFGSAVAGLGDFNLDGYSDMLIGAPVKGEIYLSF